MQRSSQQDQDGVIWQPAAIPLGTGGLDLRTPAAPGSLTKLLNARFRDENTLDRRNGYLSIVAQDAGDFSTTNVPQGWLYGHGQELGDLNHFPIPRNAEGLFRFGDTDVVWTGDRLLLARDGETCIGQSAFWGRGSGSKKWGVPAYLPVQTDSSPPDVVTGDAIETCLTETLRVVIASSDTEDLTAWVIDRATGAVLDRTDIITGGSGIYEPRVVNSGGIPVVLWLDGTDLYLSWWSGVQWSAPNPVHDAVVTFEIAEIDGGFALVWQSGGVVRIGRYLGHTTDNTDLDFGTTLGLAGNSFGALALAIAPDESIGLVWQDDTLTLWATTWDADATNAATLQIDATVGPYDGGLAACFRGLGENGRYNLVVHAGNGGLYTRIWELYHASIHIFGDGGIDLGFTHTLHILQTTTRYRTWLSSKSFRVGDEVLCWLYARNSETNFLLAGVSSAQMCGVCDREEALSRAVRATGAPGYGIKDLPMVYADPLDPYAFTWIRPYETARVVVIDDAQPGRADRYTDLYDRAGNARIGDLAFVPKLSTALYGESVYLAGSLVRNWDGMELGDAGFHDYPTVPNAYVTSDGAGGLNSTAGAYYYRVYAVRYNKRGERFQSAAITSIAMTLSTPGHDTIAFDIYTVPATNHDDVTFEVYRTEAGGTTFYLEGTIANSLTAETVNYTSTLSDAALITRAGDPHAPGIGITSELEEMGPIGCEILVTAGDRLWGAGGQVPSGTVQFSKLKEPGEGAGFDALAGTQQIDVQGFPITSIATFGDAVVFFQGTGLQAVTNNGPDNYGNGSFGVPQLVFSDGAITHWGTAVTPIGVAFWGADGPRLLGANFQVDQICAAVRELTKDMVPSGVQVDLSRQECVWYTEEGTAVLWNFRSVESKFNQLTSQGRWAQWSGLKIAGVSNALVTTDGRILYESEDAEGDDGVPFTYAGATGYIAPQALLGGMTMVRGIGIAGEYLGAHTLRLRVYYNGSPLWTDTFEWSPADDTGLISGSELATLDAAALDALTLEDRSGQYATHHRTSRQKVRHFRVEWSDISSRRPTYRLHELTLELGSLGGLGRIPPSTYSTNIGR